MRQTLARILGNTGVLTLVSLPLWFLLFWLWITISEGHNGSDPWGTFLFNYLVLVGPVAMAGLAHQGLVFGLARFSDGGRLRALAMGSTVTIPLLMSLVSVPLGVFIQLPVSVCTLVVLLLYGRLMRLPEQAGT